MKVSANLESPHRLYFLLLKIEIKKKIKTVLSTKLKDFTNLNRPTPHTPTVVQHKNMTKYLLIITFLLIYNYSEGQTKETVADYEFSSFPSFHNGFKIVINEQNGTITFIEEKQISVIDSIKADGWAIKLDTYRKEHLDKFLPNTFIVSKKINHEDYLKFKEILDSIYSLRLERINDTKKQKELLERKNKLDSSREELIYIDEDIPYEDGISFILNINSDTTIDLGNVNCDSYDAKMIKNLFDLINNKFDNIYPIINITDNSREYIENYPFHIKSLNPIYIRLFSNLSLSNFKEAVNKLPKSDEITVDVTNYKSIGSDNTYVKIKDILDKKYKSIYWVTDLPFWRNE